MTLAAQVAIVLKSRLRHDNCKTIIFGASWPYFALSSVYLSTF